MPFDYTPHPGLNLQQTRQARGPHDVVVTGPALALATLLPSLPGVPQGAGALTWPCVMIYWLFLPIIKPGGDYPNGTLLSDFLIHVSRLGVAFERFLTPPA